MTLQPYAPTGVTRHDDETWLWSFQDGLVVCVCFYSLLGIELQKKHKKMQFVIYTSEPCWNIHITNVANWSQGPQNNCVVNLFTCNEFNLPHNYFEDSPVSFLLSFFFFIFCHAETCIWWPWQGGTGKCMERLQLLTVCLWSNRFREILLYGWIWTK